MNNKIIITIIIIDHNKIDNNDNINNKNYLKNKIK